MSPSKNPNNSTESAKGRRPRRDSEPETIPPELANHPGYEILGTLGKGGMGIVYKARNLSMDRIEAIKLIKTSAVSSASSIERFRQEIRSAALLQHQNIVTAYHVIDIGGRLGFVMEYVPGQTLTEIIRTYGPISATNACHYARQVAAGLQHAMGKGLVHRDIKPDNLMLAREGAKHTIKILDFGLGKTSSEASLAANNSSVLPDGSQASLTVAGVMLGTPYYVSPEQIANAASVDVRSDIYSLGCTLFFLLTGKQPYTGKTLQEILKGHVAGEIPSVRGLRADVPAQLDEYLQKMMSKEPDDRPRQPKDVANSLTEILRDLAKTNQITQTTPGMIDSARPPMAEMPAPIWEPLPEQPDQAFDFDEPSQSSTQTISKSNTGSAKNSSRSRRGGSYSKGKSRSNILSDQKQSFSKKLIAILLILAGLTLIVVALLVRGLLLSKSVMLTLTISEPESEVVLDGNRIKLTSAPLQVVDIKFPVGPHIIEVRKSGFQTFSRAICNDNPRRESFFVTLDALPAENSNSAAQGGEFVPLLKNAIPGEDWELIGPDSAIISFDKEIFDGKCVDEPGNPNHLHTVRNDYENFRFRTDFYVDDDHDHLSFLLRTTVSDAKFGGLRGYVVSLDARESKNGSSPRCVVRCGLGEKLRRGMDLSFGDTAPLAKGKWHRLEIQMNSIVCQVSVNGILLTTMTDDGRTFDKGAFTIVLGPDKSTRLRHSEILETDPTQVSSITDDKRSRWSHQTLLEDGMSEIWGIIQPTGKKSWIETVCDQNGIQRFHFREVSRNDEFVELERKLDQGFVNIRLREGSSELTTVRGRHFAWHNGDWQ